VLWSSHIRRRVGFLTVLVVTAAAVAGAGAPPSAGVLGGPADVLDVVQIGSGSSALTNAATPVSILPLLGVGTGVGTTGAPIPLPTTASGSNVPFAMSGSASSEGALSLSADGRYLTLAGYDAAPGTAAVASTSSTTVPRVVARVDGAGNIDTSTVINGFGGNNVRGATSDDGTRFWVTGAGPANGQGVVLAPLGNPVATPVTPIGSTFKNARVPVIANGRLYVSSDKLTPPGVYAIGSGLPTAATSTIAPVAAATGNDPYSFVFTDPSTLYVADGGIKKYSFNGSSWIAEGSASAGTQLDGLAGRIEGSVVQLYATALDGTKAFAFTDSAASNAPISGSFTTILTAAANTVLKGIAFAPAGQVPPAPASTIGLSDTALGGVIGDTGNPTLTASVSNDTVSPDQIQLAATSSNQAVAADAGITVTGSGTSRTISVQPAGAVGYATITLTATVPGGPPTTTHFLYAASAAAPDATSHFLSGASDASTAIDVGDGYIVVGDDESNILRLYNTVSSGGPVKTWDFTTEIGASSIDIEAAARLGDTIYWTGSMGNNSDGSVKAARSTLFTTTVSGSGASTELTLGGVYLNLRNDLIAWDQANGDRFGFAAGAADGQIPKEINGFNVEGLDFSADGGTAYLGFRAPLLPQTDRQQALVVPVTNLTSLVGGGGPAIFGTPMLWNLGGLSVREIRRNASGQFLVIAGGYAEGGDFFLYSWDGNPAHQPAKLDTVVPQPEGAWEAIVGLPGTLANGATFQLLQDDGDVNFYGDDPPVEAKTLPLALRKARIDTFTLQLPAPPVVASAPPVIAEATGPFGAAVTYATPAANDPIDPSPVVTCLPASGSTFPLGATTVSCTATDVQGRTSVPSTFSVSVEDTTPPVLSGVPADITRDTTDPAGLAVTFVKPTAADIVDGHDTVACTPASGSTFPIGTTTVTCSAVDAAGNRASAHFTVTIHATDLSDIRDVLEQATALLRGHPNRSDADGLRELVESLTAAQDPAGWSDGNTLQARRGDRVFNSLQDAAETLRDLQRDRRSAIPDATLQGMLGTLAGAAGDLARGAIADAQAAGVPARKLVEARAELVKAQIDIARGNTAGAIGDLGEAWQDAERALGK
jgi:hypothetical protein